MKRISVFIVLMILVPTVLCSCVQGPTGPTIYPVGNVWEKNGNSFAVNEVSIHESYMTGDGTLIEPLQGCVLLAVDCTMMAGDGWKFCTDASIDENVVNSQKHWMKHEPVEIDADKGRYVLLFELNESQANAEQIGKLYLSIEFESKATQRVGTQFMLELTDENQAIESA